MTTDIPCKLTDWTCRNMHSQVHCIQTIVAAKTELARWSVTKTGFPICRCLRKRGGGGHKWALFTFTARLWNSSGGEVTQGIQDMLYHQNLFKNHRFADTLALDNARSYDLIRFSLFPKMLEQCSFLLVFFFIDHKKKRFYRFHSL